MPAAGRVGDRSNVPLCAHGCPACPHNATGPAVSGSPNVFVNDRPVLRVGDSGVHMACCGPNRWKAQQGAPGVFANDKAVHRKGDLDIHCGGIGRLIEGSDNVIVGNLVSATKSPKTTWVGYVVRDDLGDPIANTPYTLTLQDGTVVKGSTDGQGRIKHSGIIDGGVGLIVGNHRITRDETQEKKGANQPGQG